MGGPKSSMRKNNVCVSGNLTYKLGRKEKTYKHI